LGLVGLHHALGDHQSLGGWLLEEQALGPDGFFRPLDEPRLLEREELSQDLVPYLLQVEPD